MSSERKQAAGISRRDLLCGLLRARSSESALTRTATTQATEPPRADRQREAKPLPAVISWLERDLDSASFGSTHASVDAGRAAAMRAAPPAPLRPPGAILEDEFLARCTRCGDCERACPHDAIRPLPARFGVAAGTPWIDPYQAPCRMCEDFPCAAACVPKALQLEQAGPIGTAQVRALDCLNRLGSPCAACVEHCPIPDALTLRSGIPFVEPALCTGCGQCAYVCPAPDKAILLLPAPRRERALGESEGFGSR